MSRLLNTILCIDDNWTRLVGRKTLLEMYGYRVLEATSGDEGLKLFRTAAVDAVVLDYQMPGMNGDAVASRMKRMKAHVPIVLVSAYGPLPDKKLESVDAFVTVAQEPKILVSTVRQLLASRSKPFFHRWFDQWTSRNHGVRP
jgi:CheY-like chemotaxis protein